MAKPPRLTSKPGRRGSVISATEAAKAFGGLVDRVREERAVYIIERAGTPVAQIGPLGVRHCTVADLVGLLRSQERLDEKYLDDVEAGLRLSNRPAVPQDRWAR
jgi:antitoxin (DNA-binding transcriptional repressor) of toxin-antitoxin stability system